VSKYIIYLSVGITELAWTGTAGVTTPNAVAVTLHRIAVTDNQSGENQLYGGKKHPRLIPSTHAYRTNSHHLTDISEYVTSYQRMNRKRKWNWRSVKRTYDGRIPDRTGRTLTDFQRINHVLQVRLGSFSFLFVPCAFIIGRCSSHSLKDFEHVQSCVTYITVRGPG